MLYKITAVSLFTHLLMPTLLVVCSFIFQTHTLMTVHFCSVLLCVLPSGFVRKRETAYSLCQDWSVETDCSNLNANNSQSSDISPLEGFGIQVLQKIYLQHKLAGQSAVMARFLQREGLFNCHILTLEKLSQWEFQFANSFLLPSINNLSKRRGETGKYTAVII